MELHHHEATIVLRANNVGGSGKGFKAKYRFIGELRGGCCDGYPEWNCSLPLCICHTLITEYPFTYTFDIQTLMSAHSLQSSDAKMVVIITQGAFAADVERECTYQNITPTSA